MGRPLKDVIIIDNSPTAYMFQPENAIPSLNWYDDKTCTQLYEFIPVLQNLATVDDIRPFIMASVKEGVLDIDRC